MTFADRLELVSTQNNEGRARWTIKWKNLGHRNDFFIINFHPTLPKETAEAVLAVLKQDEHLRSVLK